MRFLARVSAQQQFEIACGQVADHAVVGRDDGVGEILLRLLQFENLVFDGVLGNQSVCEDSFGLADAAPKDGLDFAVKWDALGKTWKHHSVNRQCHRCLCGDETEGQAG